MNIRTLLPLLLSINVLSGCVTSRVDEMVFNEPEIGIGEATAVILGRRHGSDYATEPDFVQCVGSHIMKKDPTITIIPETYFLDHLYPWFEPRTAPLEPSNLQRFAEERALLQKLESLDLAYMIWIDGSTKNTGSDGSLSCSLHGCFGFATWSNESNYEATIWDFTARAEVGKVNTESSGQTYMPSIFVPLPIHAPVKGAACDGIGDQLLEFLSGKF